MKRIIKEGRNQTKQFQCDWCGCIFEADINDYTEHTFYGVGFLASSCPNCNKPVCIDVVNLKKKEN